MIADSRTEKRQRGDVGEELASAELVRGGYRILARNVTCRYGELDLVAVKDGILCFVEVRMRSSAIFGDPSMTVTRAKQRKVVMAAHHYLRVTRLPPMMLRFDVISVLGRGKNAVVEHIPNAFDAGY